jgi:hypothetical protein
MPDFNVRSDSVDVEQIMEQIRARIREKRGVDYTEQQIREMASVKLQKFLDARSVRSDLLTEFRRGQPDPNYRFEDTTLFESNRGIVRFIRRLLQPILKLFFSPNPLINVLHMQSQINDLTASRHQLYYELIHNLVVETTRLGIEAKNLQMRVESLSARVDFNERRARALESVVIYRPSADEGDIAPALPATAPPERAAAAVADTSGSERQAAAPPATGQVPGPGQRSRRRRRRRGRRGGPATAMMGSQPAGPGDAADGEPADGGHDPSDRGADPTDAAPGGATPGAGGSSDEP